jgi:hypothetical protein
MAIVSRYVVIEGDRVRLQERGGGQFSKTVRLPDRAQTRHPFVLMFRVDPTADADVTLTIKVRRILNRDQPTPPNRPFPTSGPPEAPELRTDYRFMSGVHRTFHHVIPGADNMDSMVIDLYVAPRNPHHDEAPGIGSISIDDVILWLQVDA